ncbi:outer membrane lipoprotein carrier protein LolA [Kitasatospora putterlickiae]|uniref:Outer membrane lipoprotein carrier protein LolA n=1 Tax=Kitasatospora putterlickiae TaxID=221725 RepID=A0ABN1YDG6_9ACTN
MTDDRATAGGGPADEWQGADPYPSRRRTLVRVAVPLAVTAAIAAGVGLVPALADSSPPELPALTAEQLITKVLGSEAQTLSGTVSVSTDLGVPSQLLGAAAGGIGGGAAPGGGDRPSSAAPGSRLTALLGGEHTVRVAVDGPERQRIGLLEQLSGYELIRDGDQVWAWDSGTNEAVHLTGVRPDAAADGHRGQAPLTGVPTTPQEAARLFLTASADSTTVTVDGTATVAGQKAYRLSVKPTRPGSTIGEARIAVSADNGVPLSVVVKGTDGDTVLDVHFTQVSFARPAAKTFEFTVPKGAKVTEQKASGAPHDAVAPQEAGAAAEGLNVIGEGWTTVLSAKLPTGDVFVPAEGRGPRGRGGHGAGSGGGTSQSPLALAKSLGKPVAGGSLISTKVLNALITDDGRVFAGAVTLPVLQSAAGVK